MLAAQGNYVAPPLDPIGITDRGTGHVFFPSPGPSTPQVGPLRGGGHRRFARIVLPLIALLLLR